MTLPTFDSVRDGYRFLARRHGYSGALNEAGVRAALEEASAMATLPKDEPAAVFFALASHAKALAGSWRTLPALVAMNVAAGIGYKLRANRDDFATLLVPIASHTLDFATVRAWFDARMETTG